MTADTAALQEVFAWRFARRPAVIFEAPGRVNLIGEHTDYNEGFVLPMAIDRTVAVAANVNQAQRVLAHSLDFCESDEFALQGIQRLPGGNWRNYVRGVAWAVQDAGHRLLGTDLAISGDVPLGAGLSSSAALEAATGSALLALAEVSLPVVDAAMMWKRAENEFVGVQCGIMDQLAAVCYREGHGMLIDCRSLDIQHIPVPAAAAIVIVDSKVPRRLEGTAYNRRRLECLEAAKKLGLLALRDLEPSHLARAERIMPDTLYRRARHVLTENARVLAAAESLRSSDIEKFGTLMYQSHASLRDDFEVSTPELDLLVDLASRAKGVLGARLTGAGFGGCTVNLVRAECVARFQGEVVDRYRETTKLPAEVHLCGPAGGLEHTDF